MQNKIICKYIEATISILIISIIYFISIYIDVFNIGAKKYSVLENIRGLNFYLGISFFYVLILKMLDDNKYIKVYLCFVILTIVSCVYILSIYSNNIYIYIVGRIIYIVLLLIPITIYMIYKNIYMLILYCVQLVVYDVFRRSEICIYIYNNCVIINLIVVSILYIQNKKMKTLFMLVINVISYEIFLIFYFYILPLYVINGIKDMKNPIVTKSCSEEKSKIP